MKLVRLILILAKEFIIGRLLWKWSINSVAASKYLVKLNLMDQQKNETQKA